MLMVRRYVLLFLVSCITISTFLPIVVHAGPLTTTLVPAACRGATAATTCTLCELGELAKHVMNFLIVFYMVFSAGVLMWAGGQYLTAGSNERAVTIAKNTLTRIAVGLIGLLCVWLIINLMMSVLLSKSFSATLPWNQLCT